ncbi:hypothetical protein N3K66_003067 [Trichothecium roseum]|uniref:Uncharacterized protein n=1 Tax=Trichothecium roseum TaxID=47278 RepID=A0ACC0V5R3_9HYPO|nr:hypothetical protein N3K66_003067 [Trichothecium roseum]
MPNDPEQSMFCDKMGVLNSENMAAVLKIAIMNKDYSFLEDMVSHFSLQIPSVFFTWAGQWMEGDGPDPQERLALLRQGSTQATTRKPRLQGLCRAVTHLAPISDAETTAAAKKDGAVFEFTREMARTGVDLISKYPGFSADDAAPLFDLIHYFDDPNKAIFELIVPKVEERPREPLFYMSFLTTLHEKAQKGLLPKQECARVCRTGASALARTVNSFAALQRGGDDKNRSPRYAAPRKLLSDFITLLIDISKETGGDSEVEEDVVASLVNKMTRQVPDLPSRELPALWLPFASQLSKKLTDRGTALDAAPYQALSSGIIRHFVDRWVGPEPVDDGNLVRDTISCGCADCEDLNDFLASLTRGEEGFSVKESRRKHLYWKLTGGGIDCSTDTERARGDQDVYAVQAQARGVGGPRQVGRRDLLAPVWRAAAGTAAAEDDTGRRRA